MTTMISVPSRRASISTRIDDGHSFRVLLVDDDYAFSTAHLAVTDVDDWEISGGGYARFILTGLAWDTTGAIPAVLADDAAVPGSTGITSGAWVFDADDGALLWWVDFEDDIALSGELPIEWDGGKLAVYDDADGLPDGGTTGQVLAKRSNDDQDVEWTDPAAGTVTSVAGIEPVAGDVDAAALADALEPFLPDPGGGGGAVGAMAIDKSGSPAGTITVDLSTGPDAVAPDVAAVAIQLPSGGASTLQVTLPSGADRGHLGIVAYAIDGSDVSIVFPGTPVADSFDGVGISTVTAVPTPPSGMIPVQRGTSTGGGGVDSVNGATGVVVLDAGDVGADASGAAATAQAFAIQRANHTGTQAQSTVTGLTSDLAGKSPTGHTHAASDITSGVLDQARLGSGSGGTGTKFLADDQTYKTPAPAGVYPFKRGTGWGVPGVTFTGANNATGPNGTRVVAQPFRVDAPIKVTAIGASVHTADAAGGFRIGIASMNATGGLAAILADSGSISTSTTGEKSYATTLTLPAGWYWRLWQANGAGAPKWYSIGEIGSHGHLNGFSQITNMWEDTGPAYGAFATSISLSARSASSPGPDIAALVALKWEAP